MQSMGLKMEFQESTTRSVARDLNWTGVLCVVAFLVMSCSSDKETGHSADTASDPDTISDTDMLDAETPDNTMSDTTHSETKMPDIALDDVDEVAIQDTEQDVDAECAADANCVPDNECMTGACVDGACSWTIRVNDLCDDENACTSGETCDAAGQCVAGSVIAVKPSICQECTCDPIQGVTCVAAAVGAPCSDATCCTTNDACVACDPAVDDGCLEWGRGCLGTAKICSAGSECSTETCECEGVVPASVCGNSLPEENEPCDDGNTEDGDGCSKNCQIEAQCTQGCANTSDCLEFEICEGKPAQVPGATGQCENSKAELPGAWTPCSEEKPCGDGLFCLGQYQWGDGWCMAAWMAKNYYSHDKQAVPDAGSPVSSSLIVCGLATVPLDIVVTLHMDHPHPEDLLITLEDPNQQFGTVLDHQTLPGKPIVVAVGSGDDAVNGTWTLHVTDTVAGNSGTLVAWSLYLSSNFD